MLASRLGVTLLSLSALGRPAMHATNVVTVVAKEYSFEMPDTLIAGWTTIRLRNDGAEPHHLILYRLDAGRTAEEAIAAVARKTAYPGWMHAAGGPQAAPRNTISEIVVHLDPGTYVAFCKVPAPDHSPHYSKGMVKRVVVAKSARVETATPTSDVEVTLVEYGFNFSGPVHPGRHVISVVNRGGQAHELIISQLAPLMTMADYAKWNETQVGLPPLVPIGGTTDIAPNGRMFIDIALLPGRYLARCRVIDSSDDRGHDLHGMVREFVVD